MLTETKNTPGLMPVSFNPFEDGKQIEKITFTNQAQKEIWLSCAIGVEQANLSYNEAVSLHLHGTLQTNELIAAIEQVTRRHEALRSVISPDGELLIIYRNIPLPFETENLAMLAKNEQAGRLTQFNATIANTPMDINNSPLFRVWLHKLSETEHVLTILKHHIIGDGWSTGIILEDLSSIYNTLVRNEDLLPEPAMQLSDYASAEAAFARSPEYTRTLNFWLQQYHSDVPVLDLPTDRPRPATRTYAAAQFDHSLAAELTVQLRSCSAISGCSLVTTLLAAFEVLLYTRTHQEDIVVGLPASGQAASGLTSVVGHCVNLLPLRTHINATSTFANYLGKRKNEVLDAYDHQRLTFSELIKKLYIPRDPSRVPLVPVMFNIDMGMDNAVSFDGLDYSLKSIPRAFENFEIYLNITNSGNVLLLEWSYNTNLFDAATIEHINDHYCTILRQVVSAPDVTIAELAGETVTPSIVSGPVLAIPTNCTTNELLETAAIKYAGNTAVSSKGVSLSYTALHNKVCALAATLAARGIGPGKIVAVCMDRSADMLISLLAVLNSGAAYLPLDPAYPADRTTFMLADSGAALLLASPAHKDRFATGCPVIVAEDVIMQLPDGGPLQKTQVDAGDLAYILYTSGSTGRPKGVKITHANLANFLLSMQQQPGICEQDRLLAITTISFDIAGLELLLPLISGAEVIIADADTARDGRLLLDLMQQERITIMQATPSTWQMMLDSGWSKPQAIKILAGGEALPQDLAAKLLQLGAELWNMYGPTETTIWSSVKKIVRGDAPVTIGKPIANTSIYMMDGSGQPVSTGLTGELYIGGTGVAPGYLYRDELTALKFVTANVPGNPRLYKTGDMGRMLGNGEIECLGRIDHQVKIRGHRIELGEIETELASLPGIRQAVVHLYEEVRGKQQLVAYFVAEYPQTDVESLKAKLRETLPEFMVPPYFIQLPAFPMTPNNKIDRKALPRPALRERPGNVDAGITFTANEQLIRNIWAEALGIEDLKPLDDFFVLGGHSLLAVKVMVALERATGTRLPIAALFSHSTIAGLARQLASPDTEKKWDALVPIKTSGTKPPLFLIHGAGLNILLFKSLSENFDADQPVYGFQALGLSHPDSIPATIEEIATRYIREILEVHPNGPYALAGYSMGGFLAYEMAQQLTAMGKKILLLGIMDTNAGNKLHAGGQLENISRKIARQFRKVPFFTKSFIANPREAWEYQVTAGKNKIRRMRSSGIVIPKNTFTDYEIDIYKRYDEALDNYAPKPHNIEVTLFRVEKRLYYLDDLVYLGWRDFALKGVHVEEVPGDHKTFLEYPNCIQFARIMQRVMNETTTR